MKKPINIIKCMSLFLGLMAFALTSQAATTHKAILDNYVNIAYAVFSDALTTANTLQKDIDSLIAAPSQANLDKARNSWRAARVPYLQSEVFRFGNPNVDEWEGQLNAWPLDEGLIDYVADNYESQMGNDAGLANIIANKTLEFAGEKMDVSNITPELLANLNELMGSEANVATGYHAIEFLLWGQDLNGVKAGAGNRPYTDYAQGKACTNGNCDRRAQYLRAATVLLISDLQTMVNDWAPNKTNNYRAQFMADTELKSVNKMLFGMGTLSLGELAGERMKVALEANSPEDEQDCFSDNTHNSHYYDAKGINNIYYGTYKRVDGSIVKGASLADAVKAKNSALAKKADATFSATDAALKAMVTIAEKPEQSMKFDQMIAVGNEKGKQLINNAVNALLAQTKIIEDVTAALGVTNLYPDSADHAL